MKETPKVRHNGGAESLLYQLGHAVIVVDADHRISYLNESAEQLLGLPGAAAVGVHLDQMVRFWDETSGQTVRLPLTRVAEAKEAYVADRQLVLEVPEQLNRRVAVSANPIFGVPAEGVAIEICDNFIESVNAGAPMEEEPNLIPDFFFVKKDGSFIKVLAEKILWIEAMENYAVLVTEEERFVVHSTLKKLALRLAELGFIRVHRSYIVPVSKIDAIEDNRLHIGENEVPIGKSYRSNLMQHLNFI